MTFRDDQEAAQARIRTLSAELEAEREKRQAAEAATRAAEAGRDELLHLNKAGARAPKQWGMSLLAALGLVGVAVTTVLYWTSGQEHAREKAELRRHHEKQRMVLYAELKRSQRSKQNKPNPVLYVPPDVLEVSGGLGKAIVRRIIRHHINEVKHCYQKGLRAQPDLAGHVVVHFTIVATGRVANSHVHRSTIGNREVERCITSAIRRWRFPQPNAGSSAMVSYRFVLRSSER